MKQKCSFPVLFSTLLAAALCGLQPARAAEGKASAPAEGSAGSDVAKSTVITAESQFQFYIENDLFTGTDRYYTNGIKFGAGGTLGPLKGWLERSSQGVLSWLLDGEADDQAGVFIGQNMYTPRDITIAAPQPYDRPWAAWLYVGGTAQRIRGDHLHTVELDVGVVGPPALGEQVQSRWHELIGSPRPAGWANQLPTEAGVLLAYLQKRRYGDNLQFVPHAGVTVGTVMTLARVGGVIRYGRHMTGFGPDTIEPGGAMLLGSRNADTDYGGPLDRVEWSVFAGVDYRGVARNIFLDGTMFHDSASVERRRGVHDISVGVTLRYESLSMALTHVRRSEEFTSPLGGSGVQRFHSLNLSWVFE